MFLSSFFPHISVCVAFFPECVAKGSCFCLGGLGAGPCSFRFRDCGRERSRAFASVRERPRAFVLCPMRCALRIGLEGGRLGGALWRCAVVIAGGGPGFGGAVPL